MSEFQKMRKRSLSEVVTALTLANWKNDQLRCEIRRAQRRVKEAYIRGFQHGNEFDYTEDKDGLRIRAENLFRTSLCADLSAGEGGEA